MQNLSSFDVKAVKEHSMEIFNHVHQKAASYETSVSKICGQILSKVGKRIEIF